MSTNNGADAAFDGPRLVDLLGVERRAVEWDWPGRIAKGKMTLVIGEPDLGKTLVSLDCASRVSRGATWPDGTPAPKGRVVIMSSEDGIEDTIAPRLDAAGADCSQIAVLRMAVRGGEESMVTLATDLDMIEQAIFDYRASLLIVDPLSAYLGDADTHRDAALRGVLTPFADLLERTRVACIGVMHPPKSVTNIIYFASGSGAFTAQSRVALGVGRDPNDESDRRRLLVKIKGNLYREVPTLAYTIEDKIGQPVLAWESDPVTGVTARDVLGLTETREDRAGRRDASDFLRDLLRDGPVAAKDVIEAAEQNGISKRTLDRAKRDAGAVSDKTGQPGKTGQGWYWMLPSGKRT